MRSESFGSVQIFWPAFSRETLIERLRERAADLNAELPIEQVVLFGSWAQGRATVRSDIDILVVYRDPERADAFEIVRRCLDTPGIEPHVYTTTEAASLSATLARMTEHSVPLFPIL